MVRVNPHPEAVVFFAGETRWVSPTQGVIENVAGKSMKINPLEMEPLQILLVEK